MLLNIKKIVYLTLLILLVSFSNLIAQDSTIKKTMPLFQSEEILNLRLEADFSQVFLNDDDSTYFPALISFVDKNGKNKKNEMKIRTRGNSRRNVDICKFTPLRLKFPKKGTKNTAFEGQRAIKLVTHCRREKTSEQNVIIEYLIYKAYNILTDSSFKVRAANINYVYSDPQKKSVQKFAFFIERDKQLAKRLGGIEIESERIHPIRMNVFHSCLMDMFQYMIGNTDFSSYTLHNIILLSDEYRKLPPTPIPYDFDWCGLVSPYYAVVNPMFKSKTVSERIYRGFKKEPEIVNRTIEIFNNKKSEILQLFEKSELLQKKERKRVLRYLNEFYRIINNERSVRMEFIDNARVVHN